MITIEALSQRDAKALKDIRLRALQDTPSAFSSTYDKESRLSDAEWMERATRWSRDRSVAYLAMDGTVACGIVAAFLDEQDEAHAYLVSMWVAPTHRRTGVGAALVHKILEWARTQNVRVMELLVTSNNTPAIRFYERFGFAMTGKITPHANDPSLSDCEMHRTVF